MNDEIVSFEVAKLAKEKGFDLKVRNYINILGVSHSIKEITYYPFGAGVNDPGGDIHLNYNEKIDFSNLITYGRNWDENGVERIYSAPTQSLLQRWLREKHNTHITVDCKNTKHSKGMFSIYVGNNNETVHTYFGHVSYEEALEKGLLQALKFIKI
jgi:hypothetical protein